MPDDRISVNEEREEGTEGEALDLHESALSLAPRWFVVVAGVAYATGFLIVSTYLGSFGVEESSGDLLRLMYLQVGFYFLLFLGSIITLCVSLVAGHERTQKNRKTGAKGLKRASGKKRKADADFARFLAALARYLNLLLVVSFLVGFAPAGPNRRFLIQLVILVCLTILGKVWMTWARRALVRLKFTRLDSWIDRHKLGTGRRGDRLCFFLLFVILDISVIWTSHAQIRRLFRPECLVFFVFVVLLAYLTFRIIFPRSELKDWQHKFFIWPRVATGVTVYYLCVLSFTYGIYPLMSPARGGGNFQSSGRVVLVFRHQETGLPDGLMTSAGSCELRRSNALIIIAQNPTYLYVADPEDPIKAGGAQGWVKPDIRPTVYELQMADIISIEHQPHNMTLVK